jgi:hypothetical protein
MDDINHPVIKASAALGAFVSLTWIDWITTTGKIAAALVSIGLFAEFAWKKVLHPLIRYLRED